ncbi:anti-sigma-K factor RskA [Thermocatellispora tengchongensis]|uniref:Regulator of SigK n=1 Tax=Thermocatellispora tengchongensis TaxID=1073253 RepID=A0A840P0M7_9ACTN|nr:anti-sigma factor [Thermocatellispora tengchongensis]MBB5132016.1 anti-sigma-K factor RskA [Thermocatellispora tengchongensis]
MNDDLHTLAGAYALDALPEGERRPFERHLERCEPCSAEVRGLTETAARLALAAAVQPPAGLRERVLAEIATVRQLAPAPSHGAAAPTVVVPRAALGGPAGTRAATAPEAASESVEERVRRRAARRRVPWRGRVPAGIAAVSAAAAVTLGVVAVDARRDLDAERARARTVAAVLAAPDAATVVRPLTGGGSATLVVSRSRGEMVVTSGDLTPLGDSRVYEMWLMGPDGVRPAGLVPGANGVSTAVVALTAKAERFGLTVEPAGGSARPTTTPILLAELPGTP